MSGSRYKTMKIEYDVSVMKRLFRSFQDGVMDGIMNDTKRFKYDNITLKRRIQSAKSTIHELKFVFNDKHSKLRKLSTLEYTADIIINYSSMRCKKM